MGFESNFGKQRKALAETLKEKRSEGEEGRKEAKKILEQAKQTESYSVNRVLHGVSRSIGEEYKQRAFSGAEQTEIGEEWYEEDISNLIPDKYRHLLDITLLAEAASNEGEAIYAETRTRSGSHDEAEELLFKLRFGRAPSEVHEYDAEGRHGFNQRISDEIHSSVEKERKEAQQFWDLLTEGRFLDPHNLNHFINAETSKRFQESFDPHSPIKPGLNFWASAHGSSYSSLYGSQLIVLSPKNAKFREFLEKSAYPNSYGVGQNTQALFEAFMKGETLPRFGDIGSIENWFGVGVREGHRQEDSSINYSWMDIADCIVDLRSGKRWTRRYSENEIAAVEKDMEAYRSGEKQIMSHSETN